MRCKPIRTIRCGLDFLNRCGGNELRSKPEVYDERPLIDDYILIRPHTTGQGKPVIGTSAP